MGVQTVLGSVKMIELKKRRTKDAEISREVC
jgi:hypothetical protein